VSLNDRSLKKTDNASLASKIAIRLWLLQRMGLSEIAVLDTCTGLGKVWSAMDEQPGITIRQWTRCDVKPRRAGTLKIEAVDAIEKMPLGVFNVVDIDPFGEPWAAYHAFLRRFTQRTAVFLTHGHLNRSLTTASATCEALGLPAAWPVPNTPALAQFLSVSSLEHTWRFAHIEHAGVIHFTKVSYYALGLTPLPASSKETTRG
jgi:hypothetical protein